MTENEAIKSLIDPLIEAQTALVQDEATNLKTTEGLIRNRDIALSNLCEAIDGKAVPPKAKKPELEDRDLPGAIQAKVRKDQQDDKDRKAAEKKK